MSQSASSAGRRLSTITLDQAIAGGSNLLVAVLAARLLGPSGFGLFSIVFTVFVAAVGAARAMVGEPLLIHPRETEERPGQVIGSGLALGASFGALILGCAGVSAIWSMDMFWALAILGLATPALVLQDQGRYLGFAVQRPAFALVLDVVWLLLMVVALTVMVLLDHIGLVWFVAAWAGSGAVAGVLVLVRYAGAGASADAGRLAWLRETWSYSWRYLAAFSVGQAGALATSIGLVGVIGARGLGAVQGALLLTRPALAVQAASVAAGVAEIARAEDGAAAAKHVRRTTVVTVVAAIGNGVVLLMIPLSLGHLALGDTWDVAEPLFLPTVVQLVLFALSSGAKAGLLGRKAVGTTVWLEGIGTLAVLVAVVVGGLLHGVVGVMWGRALVWIPILLAWWWVHCVHARRPLPAADVPS